jgi:hypothetical protein
MLVGWFVGWRSFAKGFWALCDNTVFMNASFVITVAMVTLLGDVMSYVFHP